MVKDVSQPSAERAQAVEAAYQQALAALEIYDLDAAQSALEAGRRIDDGDGRWAELAERLVQAQQIAFSVCAAMEDGWTHWHNRAFDEAQEAFGSVASLSEEAARWQRHAGYLQQGIDWALQLEEEPALAHLSRAEAELGQPQGMPLQPGEHLMALWGDRLLAERRQAVYYTRCLCNEVSTMLAERKRKDELKARNDVAGASQVLRSLIQRQESFPELVKAQAEPPDDLEL
jgi:hypothetical protein